MRSFNNLIAILLVLGCLLVFSLPAAAQGWGDGPVVVYEQTEGRGNRQSFDIGVFRSDRREFGSLRNDSAASVSVERGYRVRFCEKEGRNGEGTGRCEEFSEGEHNLRSRNSASYIRVTGPANSGSGGGWNGGGGRRPVVTVYDDRDYRGTSQQFGVGRYLSGAGQFGALRNDEASSIVVERGYRVRLCENEGTDARGSGRCDEYGEGRFNLRMNDEASYIEVTRIGRGGWGGNNNSGTGAPGSWGANGGWANNFPGQINNNDNWDRFPVVVFSQQNQSGERQEYNEGTFRSDRGELGRLANDDASSVYVGRGFRVRFCENENNGRGAGKCEEFGEGRFNLRYNDSASMIRVWRVY